MQPNSSRLGYYIVGLGLTVQFFGLVSDSWSNGQDGRSSVLSFNDPSDFLLVFGIAITLLGALFGMIGLARELAPKFDSPRLLPAVPLVLFLGVALGGLAFAYQAGDNASSSEPQASAAPVVTEPGPNDCPEGFFWHPVMNHCMSQALANAANEAPECPEGYAWNSTFFVCEATDASGNPVTTTGGGTPVCPSGYYWHPQMNHCMIGANANAPPPECPEGYVWQATTQRCAALNASNNPDPTGDPVCPVGYYWHPVMNHCMASGATPTPLPPGETPPACPPGTIWHPVMNHCMPTVCPVGWYFDYNEIRCVQSPTPTPTTTPTPPNGTPTPTPDETPTVTPTPTPEPTPECPAGYFWHPAMGHCMSTECPPGLVFNPETLYCELPGSPTPTPTPDTPTATPTLTPTTTPTPSCPDGYFWHPAMGHCMSTTCPPGLVFNPETLYCELP